MSSSLGAHFKMPIPRTWRGGSSPARGSPSISTMQCLLQSSDCYRRQLFLRESHLLQSLCRLRGRCIPPPSSPVFSSSWTVDNIYYGPPYLIILVFFLKCKVFLGTKRHPISNTCCIGTTTLSGIYSSSPCRSSCETLPRTISQRFWFHM